MAMLQKLTREPPENAAADFGQVYRTGLARVQALAEKTWTDYNDHDPGVTILQLLSYALTDIAYRVEHPIEDILAPSPHAEEQSPPDTFFTGEEILTCDPLTSNDYRKLLYDRIGPLKNAWLGPSSSSDIKGLIHVRLQPWRQDDSEDQVDSRYLQSTAMSLLRAYRNIGEDFESVEILKPLNVALQAEIHVGFEDKPEDILARILFEIGDQLIPFPQVVNIDTRFQQGITPDQIFVGPLLNHGHIDDGHLEDLPPAVTLEKVLSIIRNVPSVLTVRSVVITTRSADGPGGTYEMVPPRPILIPRDHIPYLDLETSVSSLKVFRDGYELRIDHESVQKSFDHLVRLRLDRELFARRRMHDIDYREIPFGRYRHLEQYASIQHEFPIAYGLGRYGIPDLLMRTFEDASGSQTRRKAQVRQLKAYLLFFEQLLANQLSQLANVSRLFSLDARMNQTYFWQDVSDAPDIASVLSSADGSDELNEYRQGLEKIIRRHDPHLDRRERVLNHLLARFNEKFEDEKLELLRLEQLRRRRSGQRDMVRIGRKREFLEDYASLSARRGTGIDYSMPAGYGIDIADRPRDQPVDAAVQRRVLLRSRHDISSKSRHRTRRRQMLDRGSHPENYRLTQDGHRLVLIDEHDEVIAYTPEEISSEVQLELAAGELSSQIGRIGAMPHSEQGSYIDLSAPSPCALERRVSLLAGCTTDVYLLEHVLLRPLSDGGTDGASWTPESYSLKASFFLSGWQSRFQMLDYRQFAEKVVRENCPAHVATQCYWLSREDMSEFKTLYYDWRAAKADSCRRYPAGERPPRYLLEQVDELAEQLRLFIDRQLRKRDRQLPGAAH